MSKSKSQPYFNQADMAILTPPWVVVMLILFSVVVLALLLWSNSKHDEARLQANNLNDRLEAMLATTKEQDNEKLKSLTQIGTSLKLFDSRFKNLTRKLTVIANEVDLQRNVTLQMQDSIIALQTGTANQLTHLTDLVDQLDSMNNQSSLALNNLSQKDQDQAININQLSARLEQSIKRTEDLSTAVESLKISDQFNLIAKQIAAVNSKQVQQQWLISQLSDEIKIQGQSVNPAKTDTQAADTQAVE